jgi:hypothetical protein
VASVPPHFDLSTANGLTQEEWGGEVDGQNLIPILTRESFRILPVLNSRGVQNDVNGALEFSFRVIDEIIM